MFDPDGRWLWGAVIGAAVEYGTQVATNVIQNGWSKEALTNVNLKQIGIAAATGLVTGGLGKLRD